MGIYKFVSFLTGSPMLAILGRRLPLDVLDIEKEKKHLNLVHLFHKDIFEILKMKIFCDRFFDVHCLLVEGLRQLIVGVDRLGTDL